MCALSRRPAGREKRLFPQSSEPGIRAFIAESLPGLPLPVRSSLALDYRSRVTLVLFGGALLVSGVGRNRGLRRAFEKAVRRKPLARWTRAICKIEWSDGEVLKLTGVGTEVEEEVHEHVGVRIDGGKRCDQGAKQGSGREQGGRGRSAVNRPEFSRCGGAVSCCSSDQQWWRTELELSSGKSFRRSMTAIGPPHLGQSQSGKPGQLTNLSVHRVRSSARCLASVSRAWTPKEHRRQSA